MVTIRALRNIDGCFVLIGGRIVVPPDISNRVEILEIRGPGEKELARRLPILKDRLVDSEVHHADVYFSVEIPELLAALAEEVLGPVTGVLLELKKMVEWVLTGGMSDAADGLRRPLGTVCLQVDAEA